MTLAMTKSERETFLAAVHIGVISIADHPRAPLTVPIWYDYRPGGELCLITERHSRKGRLLADLQRFSLCVQEEAPPYKYVSVEGPVVAIEIADVERDLRPMAHRYLGPEMGDRYVAATAEERERGESVLVRMTPEQWLSADYSKQYAL
ncbi:MAG TPA: pyridoxamine 5'-phosphate oxidase family protein [Terriglobales bacterium]|nr:pyridoxamine 5'-phosphate oxidase family protein [Terriglobales bacterium]